KPDDVLVGLAGMGVTDWPSLTNALQGQQAGNTVEVVFYRGGEKQSVMMELSHRPMPEIPDTPEKLAKTVEQKYASVEKQLDELLGGISEEEASYKPAPDAWSVREILAHLIHGERGDHTWMDSLISGFEPWYDDFGGNLQERVDATVAAYPSMADLREELRRNCKETVAFLANLPDDFLARKGSYWRLAYNMVDEPYHFNAHLDQMRSAIEAARGN
ncbi:MAG TPA: DinB family protein, partial [Anaerolineales bacterium]|nr:DinB family protein [Anaerolineales bacterium]